jgi:chemotaxis protein methyltransferase CheR
LPDLQPNSPAIRQKYGEKCAAAVDLQPTTSESDRLLGRYLIDQGLYLEAAPRLKDRLLFHHHALGHDGVFNEFELILCRNVMIYFDIEMQRQVLKLFAQSLHREGFLMLGPSDGLTLLAREAGFRPDPRGQHLYRLEARP